MNCEEHVVCVCVCVCLLTSCPLIQRDWKVCNVRQVTWQPNGKRPCLDIHTTEDILPFHKQPAEIPKRCRSPAPYQTIINSHQHVHTGSFDLLSVCLSLWWPRICLHKYIFQLLIFPHLFFSHFICDFFYIFI